MNGGRAAGARRGALLGALAGILLLPAVAGAWMPATHGRIAADAVELLPPPLRDALRPDLAALQRGSVYPDLVLLDFDHHAWCPDADCGDAPDHLAAGFAQLVRDFPRRPPWVRALAALPALVPAGCAPHRAEETETLAFRLGILAHYLADVCEPYHAVPYVEPVATRHLAFEREVDLWLPRLHAAFDGANDDIGGQVAAFAIEQARAARADLAAIDVPGPRTERFAAAVDRSYSRAVNAVADLWYALLVRVPLD